MYEDLSYTVDGRLKFRRDFDGNDEENFLILHVFTLQQTFRGAWDLAKAFYL